MSAYWVGMTVGLILGGMLGFFLCALMTIAKRADREMELKKGKHPHDFS